MERRICHTVAVLLDPPPPQNAEQLVERLIRVAEQRARGLAAERGGKREERGEGGGAMQPLPGGGIGCAAASLPASSHVLGMLAEHEGGDPFPSPLPRLPEADLERCGGGEGGVGVGCRAKSAIDLTIRERFASDARRSPAHSSNVAPRATTAGGPGRPCILHLTCWTRI